METLEKIDKSLTVCKISTTVQDISEKIFSTYDSLESIECDSDYFKSIDGVLFTADYKRTDSLRLLTPFKDTLNLVFRERKKPVRKSKKD